MSSFNISNYKLNSDTYIHSDNAVRLTSFKKRKKVKLVTLANWLLPLLYNIIITMIKIRFLSIICAV